MASLGAERGLLVVASRAAGALGTQAAAVEVRGLSSHGSWALAHRRRCPTACGVFPDQGSHPSLLHWQADALPLSYRGSPGFRFWGFFLNLFIKLEELGYECFSFGGGS